jgi:hypothetical protein
MSVGSVSDRSSHRQVCNFDAEELDHELESILAVVL